VLAIVHFRLRDASHRTAREDGDDECPGSEAEDDLLVGRDGGKSFATQRSP
jgi:hypothetical protein